MISASVILALEKRLRKYAHVTPLTLRLHSIGKAFHKEPRQPCVTELVRILQLHASPLVSCTCAGPFVVRTLFQLALADVVAPTTNTNVALLTAIDE
eukprot:SAG31_NODE_988_length_10542_cov_52.848319_7_plen_97_part_00